MAAKKYETLTFEELKTVLENAEVGQLLYRIEKRGQSYVLPAEFLSHIMSDHKFYHQDPTVKVSTTGPIPGAGGATWDSGLQADPDKIIDILQIFATYITDATVINRTTEFRIPYLGRPGVVIAGVDTYFLADIEMTLPANKAGIVIWTKNDQTAWTVLDATPTRMADKLPKSLLFTHDGTDGGQIKAMYSTNGQALDMSMIDVWYREVGRNG